MEAYIRQWHAKEIRKAAKIEIKKTNNAWLDNRH